MDVISKRLKVYNEYLSIDDRTVRTVIRELKRAEFIVLKEDSKEDSLDYKDFIVSLKCNDWFKRKMKEKIQILYGEIYFSSKAFSESLLNK